MKSKVLLLAAAMIVTVAAAFGQAPKTNSPVRPNQASDKQERRNALFLPKRLNAQRAPQATALLLDSTVVEMNPAAAIEDETDQKTVYRYNAAGNLILQTTYNWNADTQQWEEYYGSGYDDRGNQTLSFNIYWDERWDEELQQYIERKVGYKYEYAYDHLNWQTLSANYSWENGQWTGTTKRTSAYTDLASSYTETETDYSWVNGDWQIARKEELTFEGQRQAGGENEALARNYDPFALPAAEKHKCLARVYRYYQDGTITGGNKTEFVKDTDGSVSQENYFSWNTAAGTWEETGKRKYVYAYNVQGLLTQYSEYDWDTQDNAWSAPSSDDYTYTFAGSNVSSVTLNGDSKTEYTYDSQNRAVTAIESHLNGEAWEKYQAHERAFDAYGNVILSIEKYDWHDNDWRQQYKYEWAYDANGNETLYSRYRYDSDTKTFVLESKTEHAYDASGRQTMYSYISNYNGGSGSKSEYTYDANGNPTTEIEYDYNTDTQTFVPNRKWEYTFGDVLTGEIIGDFEYNILSVKQSDWQDGAWVVELEGRYDWTFDAANNPLSMSMYWKESGQEIWYGTMRFYWSQHEISGLSQTANSEWRVWIAGGELHIEGAPNGDTVQIFDITGRQAINCIRPSGSTINISRLPQGVYVLKLGNKTKKFVKE